MKRIDFGPEKFCSESPTTESHESNAELIEGADVWAPASELGSNKRTQFYEQEDGSPREYQAKSALNSDQRTKRDCGKGKEQVLNSPAARNDFGKQSNDKSKKTLRLKKGFLRRFVILSLAIGRCVTAKNIDELTVKNEVK